MPTKLRITLDLKSSSFYEDQYFSLEMFTKKIKLIVITKNYHFLRTNENIN